MDRLIGKIKEFVVVNGKGELCYRAKVCERTVERWIKGEAAPSDRYQTALACGCTHEEALELAQEGSPSQGKAS